MVTPTIHLDFTVADAAVVPFAAVPTLAFKIGIRSAGPVRIHNILLCCQLRIEPAARRYQASEQERLHDLFGSPADWGRSLHSMLWTNVSAVVPAFEGETQFELPVPCTYDFNVAGTRYFDGVEVGDVPLCLLFSGTIFYQAADGRLQVTQVPWDREAKFRLQAAIWKDMMDHYYPSQVWLPLPRLLFDRLRRQQRIQGEARIEQMLEALLDQAETSKEVS